MIFFPEQQQKKIQTPLPLLRHHPRDDPRMGCCMSTSSEQAKGSRGRSRSRGKRRGRKEGLYTDHRGRRPQGVDTSENELLQNAPGRMCVNGASDMASAFTQQGKKGTNQDAMLVWESFTSREDTVFCGVFDGHGPFGHMVAKKVRDALPVKICHQWKVLSHDDPDPGYHESTAGSKNSEETASSNMDEDWIEPLDNSEWEKFPEMYATLRQSLLKSFRLTDMELKLHPTIDCFCSGSTAVNIIKQGQDLIIANLGDSRAILGTRDKDGTLVAVQLTVDLKPNLPSEAARIQQCSGRVFALQDEPEVARVWLPNSDSPGLAMARAFGDFCLKDYGLISIPHISYRRLTDRDEFIVLATDGIWDVLSNKEVVDVVALAPSRGTAARALVDSAVRAWRLKFPTSKIDDCAAVCLFLHPPQLSDQENDLSTPKMSTDNLTPTAVEVDEKAAANADEMPQPDLGGSHPVSSTEDHTCTQTKADEITPIETPKGGKLHDGSPSARSLADCISTAEEDEWSALEGVTRVNTLLNIPRFLSSDKRSSNRKKSRR